MKSKCTSNLKGCQDNHSNPGDKDPRTHHIQYFIHCLKYLPEQYTHLETNRLTLVHFAIQSLDILGFFNDNDDAKIESHFGINKDEIIKWIYSLQIVSKEYEITQNDDSFDGDYVPYESTKNDNNEGGFQGGTVFHTYHDDHDDNNNYNSKSKLGKYRQCHLAMTYSALCTLIALGDNLQRVDKQAIIMSMKTLQQSNGSFQCISSGSENDLRFLYCSCAISFFLNDWSGIDKGKALDYIRSCRSYDGAYGLIPGQEAHGGSTYCAVASLFLMGELNNELGSVKDSLDTCTAREELIQWCVFRQKQGLQGRPNKNEDTCYSFWIGACLAILGCDHLLDRNSLQRFVIGCQSNLGGFTKFENGLYPDLLHSFYSLAWLSFPVDQKGDDNALEYFSSLNEINSALGLCQRHVDHYCFSYK